MKRGIVLFLIVFTSAAYSQTTTTSAKTTTVNSSGKVYTSIPGASDQIDSESIIQKLMIIKKLPIQKLTSENQNLQLESAIVKDFTLNLRDLDTKSRSLYDFQSPFRDMTGTSSDMNVLEAIAGRKAKKQSYRMMVNRIAKPDAFMSVPLPRDQVLSPSEFTVTINTDTFKVKFTGGTVSQLLKILQDQAGSKIDFKLINDTATTSILVFSGKATGEKNKISFGGDLKTLFETGLLTSGNDKSERFIADFAQSVSTGATPILPDQTGVVLKPGSSADLPVNPNFTIKENTIFSYNSFINPLASPAVNTNNAAVPFDLPLLEPLTVSNQSNSVNVGSGGFITILEEKTPPPVVVSNFTDILTIFYSDGTSRVFSTGFSNTLSQDKNKTVSKITVKNGNTDRDIRLSDIKLETKLEEGGIQPKNIISKASDSSFSMDGVEVKRDKNSIDDLIDGVTLNLKNESPNTILVDVDHNYQKVQDALLAWVESYNKVMVYLDTLTKPSQDRTALMDRPAETMKDGIFQSEYSFLSLKAKLRSRPSNPYPTIYGSELSLLAQIGIFTKKAGAFNAKSDEWASAAIGILNTDPDQLSAALKTRYDGVEQLFAYSTDKDLVMDNGIAVIINSDLKMALGTGTFLERRIAFNDQKVKENGKQIDKMNSGADDYELEQRQKYGKMNQAISTSQSQQKYLSGQLK